MPLLLVVQSNSNKILYISLIKPKNMLWLPLSVEEHVMVTLIGRSNNVTKDWVYLSNTKEDPHSHRLQPEYTCDHS